ncbi:DMT family transporter [Thermoflavimicrobium dichotomicum]|uniref:Permease of the drug/metabolite transporter (DMT) superfamily n=1 Tax=Thermoflavimicrobium dichotomicum TaxID=46223 RepID=A0A1I3S9J0_9BACL|nr:DMT family transporter [Thermoflavimicrobium dichotomicum]SFJ55503.1 Permease of the drug/metabolite transporter (DMT) superfamily [Thermoflavimicrobium dichotomicum]
MNKLKSPYFLLILANLIWGGNFVVGRAAANYLPAFTFSFLRWCIAFIIFLPFIWRKIKEERQILMQHRGTLLLMTISGIVGYNTCLYFALHYTTSINASVVNSTTPLIIAILSFLIIKERLNIIQMIGTILSIIGVLFILSQGSMQTLFAFSFNIGDLLVIIAVMSWSFYSVIVKKYAGIIPKYSSFCITMFIGIILLLPLSIWELQQPETTITWTPSLIFILLFVGFFASIIAFLSWNTAVEQVGASRAGVFLNLIPVFASIFAIIFIGETLTWYQAIGGICVIIGVLVSAKRVKTVKNKDTLLDKKVRTDSF